MDSHLEVSAGTGADVRHPLAGIGSRSYAYVLDWHVRVVVVLGWYLACMLFLGTADLIGFGSAADSSVLLWLNVPPMVIYLLYHPVLELAMSGNSPGKLWAGVRIVDEHGAPPTPGAVLVRNVFRLIDSLPLMYAVGILTVMFTRRQVRLGDMVAGTLMIVDEDRKQASLEKIDRISNAAVDPRTAELVVDLLERWSSMSRERRAELGRAVLERQQVRLAKGGDRAIRAALQELLRPQ